MHNSKFMSMHFSFGNQLYRYIDKWMLPLKNFRFLYVLNSWISTAYISLNGKTQILVKTHRWQGHTHTHKDWKNYKEFHFEAANCQSYATGQLAISNIDLSFSAQPTQCYQTRKKKDRIVNRFQTRQLRHYNTADSNLICLTHSFLTAK